MRWLFSHAVAAAALALATAASVSSCVVPLAAADQNCTTYCALLQACGAAGAPTGDCSSWCTVYQAQVEHAGCNNAFNDAVACFAADASCNAASLCGSQTEAFLGCTQQFCTDHPSDAVCPSGG